MDKKKKRQMKQVLCLVLAIMCVVIGMLFETQDTASNVAEAENKITYFDIDSIPEYTNQIYITLNDNMPYFKEEEYTKEPFEKYSELDSLGRCRSCICKYLQRSNAKGREKRYK